MTEFAAYEPRRGPPDRPLAFRVEEATPDDLDAVAALSAARNGGDPDRIRAGIARRLDDPEREGRLFVARVEGAVAGYGWVDRLEPSAIPGGWYLSGLVVAPRLRRRGLGQALTRHRLSWLAACTDTVWYIANARNRPTIDLHAAFGFEEVDRDITVPRCAFEGGVGVLYRLRLESGA